MPDLKLMIEILERNNIEYSWYFLNKRYELHLGDSNVDQLKYLLKGMGSKIPFKWGEYSW